MAAMKVLILWFLISITNGDKLPDGILYELIHHERPSAINDTLVREAWRLFDFKAMNFLREKVNDYEQFYNSLLDEQISHSCDSSMKFLFRSARAGETWAVMMIDSWAKFPSGIFEGTFTNFGSYHQCLDVNKFLKSDQVDDVVYCTLKLKPLLPARPRFHNIHEEIPQLQEFSRRKDHAVSVFSSKSQYFYYTSFRLGLCLPANCSLEDVNHLTQKVGAMYVMQGRATKCESSNMVNQVTLTNYQLISIIIIALSVMASIVGTICDIFSSPSNKELDGSLIQIMSAFSITRNARCILNTRKSNSTVEFTCLYGIRVLTMSWIILGHLMLWSHREAFGRSFNILSIVDPFMSIGFFNGVASINTFFLISGFLTCYITMNITHGSREEFSIVWFLFSRYFRLTPGMIFSVCLLFLLPLFGSGPLWSETLDPLINGCEQNWWVNLLYLQDYVNTDNICHLPTWWLSIDMHFHIVSLFFILVLYKSYKSGFVTVTIFVAVCCSIVGYVNYVHGIPPAFIWTQPQVDEIWTEMTIIWMWKPQYHASSYFTGFLLGYFMYRKNKSMMVKLSKNQVLIGWTLAIVSFLVILKINVIWHYGYNPWNQTFAAVWSSMAMLIWSLSVAWVIFACYSGHGWLINDFLSLKFFKPLARCSYMVYLTHMLLIWSYSASRSFLTEVSSLGGLYILISHLVLSYALGFICTILVESPFLELQKIMLQRHKRRASGVMSDPDDQVMKVLTAASNPRNEET